jgi:5-methylcytosine-specific restriction protein A
MPSRSPRPCKVTGCPNPASGKFCEEHASYSRTDRGSGKDRGWDIPWRRLRKIALARDHYICVLCLRNENNRPKPARDVDHIIPVAKAPHLRLVLENLQSLCRSCHSKKTATEDGAFGNARRTVS